MIHAFSPKQRAFSLKEWASIFRNNPILDRVKHELNSTRSEFWRGDKRDYSEKSLEKTLIMRFHYCSLCANDTLLSTSRREYRHGSSLLTCRFALLRSLTAENVRCSHTRTYISVYYSCLLPVFLSIPARIVGVSTRNEGTQEFEIYSKQFVSV